MAIRVCWGHMDSWNPHFGGRGSRRGSAMAPSERAMVVSYRLSIVTVAPSAICDRKSPTLKSRGYVTFMCPNLGVFPLEQTRHVGVARREHPKMTNGEIIFEEFQPMWSQSTNVTDRQMTCDRNTVLCTKVHRAVRTIQSFWCLFMFLIKYFSYQFLSDHTNGHAYASVAS